MEWGILFIGAVGSGKTQAIQTISDIDVVNTEELATDEVKQMKSHTTVAMDVGAMLLSEQDKVRLYGAPGQDRFSFMWDILLDQSKGVVLLVNHCGENPLGELEHYLGALEERVVTRRVPVVVGITHMEQGPRRLLGMYQSYINTRGCTACTVLPPVIEIDARSRLHVRAALSAMTAQLEMAERFPKTGAAGLLH